MHELALVFFTVLAQGTIGLFLTLGTTLLINTDEKRQQVLTRLLLVVLVMLCAAGFAAMTHLGQPLRAPNVVFGLEHFSVLSVEIMTTSIFGGAVFTYAAMSFFKILPKFQKLVLVGAMGISVLLLLAISNVYVLETVPAWDSGWTVFQFCISAFIIGLPAAALVLRTQAKQLGNFQKHADRAIGTAAMLVLGAALIGYSLYLFWLGQVDLPKNPFSLKNYQGGLIFAHLTLIFAGLGLFSVSANRGNNGSLVIAGIATVSVIAAQLCGRIFFYDMHLFAGGM